MTEDTLEDVVELFDSNQIEDEEITELDETQRLLTFTFSDLEKDVEVVEVTKEDEDEDRLSNYRFEVIVRDFETGDQSDIVDTAQEACDVIMKYSH